MAFGQVAQHAVQAAAPAGVADQFVQADQVGANAEHHCVAARQARHHLQFDPQMHLLPDVLRGDPAAVGAPLMEGFRRRIQARVDGQGPVQAPDRLAGLQVEQVLARARTRPSGGPWAPVHATV